MERDKRSYKVAVKKPGGLDNATAKPKSTGVLKRSEAAECKRSGWNCWHSLLFKLA
jgi:hypothetical protein